MAEPEWFLPPWPNDSSDSSISEPEASTPTQPRTYEAPTAQKSQLRMPMEARNNKDTIYNRRRARKKRKKKYRRARRVTIMDTIPEENTITVCASIGQPVAEKQRVTAPPNQDTTRIYKESITTPENTTTASASNDQRVTITENEEQRVTLPWNQDPMNQDPMQKSRVQQQQQKVPTAGREEPKQPCTDDQNEILMFREMMRNEMRLCQEEMRNEMRLCREEMRLFREEMCAALLQRQQRQDENTRVATMISQLIMTVEAISEQLKATNETVQVMKSARTTLSRKRARETRKSKLYQSKTEPPPWSSNQHPRTRELPPGQGDAALDLDRSAVKPARPYSKKPLCSSTNDAETNIQFSNEEVEITFQPEDATSTHCLNIFSNPFSEEHLPSHAEKSQAASANHEDSRALLFTFPRPLEPPACSNPITFSATTPTIISTSRARSKISAKKNSSAIQDEWIQAEDLTKQNPIDRGPRQDFKPQRYYPDLTK